MTITIQPDPENGLKLVAYVNEEQAAKFGGRPIYFDGGDVSKRSLFEERIARYCAMFYGINPDDIKFL